MQLWLRVAMDELERNVAEVPGPGTNPRIAEYLTGVGQQADDNIPWCAAFVGWVLGKAGIAGSGKANARSYTTWGKESPVRPGAIGVFWRGHKDSWMGHVGFVLDGDSSELFIVGGNQSNRVSVAAYPRSRLLTVRWPG